MRSIVLAAAAAAAASMIAAARLPAHAQEAIDAARVASYEARFRDLHTRRESCHWLLATVRAGRIRRAGSYQRAAAAHAKACQNVEPSVLGAFVLARTLEVGGDAGAADSIILSAQAAFTGNPLLLVGAAGRKARAGEMDAANRLLDQALALGPSGGARDPDSWTPFADVLLDGEAVMPLRLRVYDEAWRRAETRRSDAEKVRVLELRATELLQASHYREALADLDRAEPIADDSMRPRVHVFRARAKKGLGDAEGARADFAAALAVWPPVAAWELLDRRYAAIDAAPEACRTAVSSATNHVHDAAGDTDATMAAADECIAAGHRATGLAFKAGERSRLGDTTGALALLDEAIAADGTYAYAHVLRGSVLHSRARRNAEARASLDRAIELDPKNSHAFFVRAAILVDLGDRQAARADYEHTLGLDPTALFIDAHIRNLVALGDHRCALDAIHAAIRYAIASADVYRMRPTVEREVNKLPRDQRQCAAPIKLGAAFEF